MSDIVTREIEFTTDIGEARGFVAMPAAAADAGPSGAGEDGDFPGVLLIHEWWGINDHVKDLAQRFAREGYVTLAPDLYDGKSTADREEAAKLMAGLRPESAVAVMVAALEALDQEYSVSRIGVVGFCMGGSMALLVGCHSNRMSAIIPFYGDHPPEEELARVHAPILFIGAEDDPWITRDRIADLKAILERRHKTFEIVVPAGTQHAFFNDTRPDAHNAEAAREMWEKVKGFLRQELVEKRHQPAGVNPTWPADRVQ